MADRWAAGPMAKADQGGVVALMGKVALAVPAVPAVVRPAHRRAMQQIRKRRITGGDLPSAALGVPGWGMNPMRVIMAKLVLILVLRIGKVREAYS